MRILMVCLGNICRSPLAQGILEQKILDRGLDWAVDSCGTSAFHIGEQADRRSIQTASGHGIDIRNQRARQLQKKDLYDFDLILAMDQSNYHDILQLSDSEEEKKKVKLILNYSFPGQNRAVPDPYYEGGFDYVYELLDEACEKVVESLITFDDRS